MNQLKTALEARRDLTPVPEAHGLAPAHPGCLATGQNSTSLKNQAPRRVTHSTIVNEYLGGGAGCTQTQSSRHWELKS